MIIWIICPDSALEFNFSWTLDSNKDSLESKIGGWAFTKIKGWSYADGLNYDIIVNF